MKNSLTAALTGLRDALDLVYAEDTSSLSDDIKRIGWRNLAPSAGHCAVTAMLVRSLFGGDFMSAKVDGQSHWFNSFDVGGQLWDVDITGDQFGRSRVQVVSAGAGLYPDARTRDIVEINEDTRRRYRLLMERLEVQP